MKKRSQKRNMLIRALSGKVSDKDVQKIVTGETSGPDPLRPVTLCLLEPDGRLRVLGGSGEETPDKLIIKRSARVY